MQIYYREPVEHGNLSFCLKKSPDVSLCSRCFVSKRPLGLLGLKLSQARQTTHCSLSLLTTDVQVKPKATYALSYFLLFGSEGSWFGSSFDDASSSALRLCGSPVKNLSIMLTVSKHSFTHTTPSLKWVCAPSRGRPPPHFGDHCYRG